MEIIDSLVCSMDIGFKNIKVMKARVFGSINKSAIRMEQHPDTTQHSAKCDEHILLVSIPAK
jgi:hypothetical protein